MLNSKPKHTSAPTPERCCNADADANASSVSVRSWRGMILAMGERRVIKVGRVKLRSREVGPRLHCRMSCLLQSSASNTPVDKRRRANPVSATAPTSVIGHCLLGRPSTLRSVVENPPSLIHSRHHYLFGPCAFLRSPPLAP